MKKAEHPNTNKQKADIMKQLLTNGNFWMALLLGLVGLIALLGVCLGFYHQAVIAFFGLGLSWVAATETDEGASIIDIIRSLKN